jgi:3',5'-cyclic-AMP phosphodiesterase
MPIYLPPISRREFVKRVALAGAGLALAPSAHAGLFGKSRDKHTFALLSDTHIAANAAEISRGVNMTDHLLAVGSEIVALPKKPAAVLVNGDLALTFGLSDDYATFGRLLDPIRTVGPVHLMLGNHDNRQNFWTAFPKEAGAQHPVANRQAAVFSAARANWYLLDSLDATNSTPGELGTAQLEWLALKLESHRNKPAIIVSHHNLWTESGVPGLKDSAALAGLFTKHRHIKAFIFGHTHDWHVRLHESGVHLINLPPVAYVFKAGRPSGWVRATLATDGMEIQLLCLDTKHPEHGQIKQLNWREG